MDSNSRSPRKEKRRGGSFSLYSLRMANSDWARDELLSLSYWLFGPPIAALVLATSLIWAFGWAFRGFRAGR
jgi:hypothetical protein